ncbi:hypothetical protein AJ79_01171 [Helicocarpus griseus UAMH5409]|uniref:Uncharacterized protein n=1 Tax=Helicocarpus griseus UAMH5409 TaxID=1447875 RepID=A0A2B7Y8N3_9EURO|nr:hypothetical protein AJ79_01171 [Helicocarpus griseus UAMH5409]
MTDINIDDSAFASLKDKVVIVTGGSSGIGLGTVKLLLATGAKVVIGDLNPPPQELLDDHGQSVKFLQLDVTHWKSLVALFKQAKEAYGPIDHVFANAGITGKANFFDDTTDENGDPIEPKYSTIDINLTSVMNTVKLAIFYMKQQKDGGSIVMAASASSFQRFSNVDYTTAKHGVLGLLRGLTPLLHPRLPIRLNAIAPSWTDTNLTPRPILEAAGATFQTPHAVARSVAFFMSSGGDSARHGQLIFSHDGKYREIEEGMLEMVKVLLEPLEGGGASNLEIMEGLKKLFAQGKIQMPPAA